MKINLGCGNKKKDGFLGVDAHKCDAAELIHDIESGLPFTDSSVDEVWMDNLIEHVRDIPQLMREIHRVGTPGARITIITPHFTSLSSWRDPTHVHHLSVFSMDHFCKTSVAHYTGGGYKKVSVKLSFPGGVMGVIARLIYSVSPRKYEQKWCFIFRASTITYILEKTNSID
jgi:ubiquinone/menaquinone biosynthesis C-methylase UbiE